MSTLRVNTLQNTSTTDGGISINNSGHVTVDGVAMPSAGPLSNRNLIINGAMQVAQRGTSQSGLTDSPAYLVDRFAYRRGGSWGTNSFTISQQSSGAPDGFTHFLRLAQSGTAAAPPTNTFCALATYLEGTTVYQAGFGTSAAQPLTLSFWAKASQAGTYCLVLRGGGGSSQAFIAEYSVTSSWQRFTVNIPARTEGTWATNTDGSFFIEWIVAADSDGTFSGSTGWTATDNRFTTNQIETFASTAGATFDLCGVQLEVGQVATPFEHRSYGDELAKCQRYYFRVTSGGNGETVGVGTAVTSHTGAFLTHLPVPMRVAPSALETTGTVSDYRIRMGASTNDCTNGPSFGESTETMLRISAISQNNLSANNAIMLLFQASSTTPFLAVSAEL